MYAADPAAYDAHVFCECVVRRLRSGPPAGSVLVIRDDSHVCLTIQCHGASECVDLTPLVDQYHGLDTSTPGLAAFRTRLGLSFVDALGTVDDPLARRIAVDVIDYATATRDGYAACDLLAQALTSAEEIMARSVTATAMSRNAHAPASP